MDHTRASKHAVAIDGLQITCNRTQDLVPTLRRIQSKGFDPRISRLCDYLTSSLSLLLRRISELEACLLNEVARGDRSICAIDGLNECADLCGESHRLLSILEELRDAESTYAGHLMSPNALTADEGHLEDLMNNMRHIAGRMDVLNRVFAVARKLWACITTDSPLSAQNRAAVQTYLYAQKALVDLVQKLEAVDSMIGKMPPACETYLNIESFVANETKRERDLRMSDAAARMIKLHLRSWTNVMDGSAAKYGYRILTEVVNTASISDPSTETAVTEPSITEVTIQNPATGSRIPSQNRDNNKDSHSISKKSSIASIRPGTPNDLKPSLKRKKSVTWDPLLDEKHNTQDPSTGRHEPQTEGLPFYNDRISEPRVPDPAITKALDAIQFEYGKLRPSCLNLLDAGSALLEGYSHGREYRRLSELLMANVLEKLDSLRIDPREESSRWIRKGIATDVSELLQLMDTFILDHRNTNAAPGISRIRPPQDDEKSTLRPRDTGSQRQLTQKHPPMPSSETSNPSQSPCLGHKILTLIPQELLDGGFRTLYIQHPPFHTPRFFANFYLRIPPASMHGDHVRARLLHPENTTEQLDAYYDVELVLDQTSRGAGRERRRRSRSIGRVQDEDVPDICFCEERPDCCEEGSGWRHTRGSPGRRGSSHINNNHADDRGNSLNKNATGHNSKKPPDVCKQEDRGGGVRGYMGSDGCDCRDCRDSCNLRCAEYKKPGRRTRRGRNPRPREDRMQAWPWLGISLR